MEGSNIWVRIDNRLVHGQVIETWIPYFKSKYVVVANDELNNDAIRQEIIKLAIPASLKVFFCGVQEVLKTIKKILLRKNGQIFILFASCQDAKKAFDIGLKFRTLNLGNLHYGPGKIQVCDHIFLSQDDISCLRYLNKRGISLDFRCVPNNPISISLDELWK